MRRRRPFARDQNTEIRDQISDLARLWRLWIKPERIEPEPISDL
jgi:hypothetical protein